MRSLYVPPHPPTMTMANKRNKGRSLLHECLPVDWWPSLDACCSIGTDNRYLHVVILCCMVAIICSIDRTAMSVAIMPMSQMYGWSGSVKGAISSAFNWGHTITNLAGGYAAAVYSPKHVLSWGVVVWSAFTILTPGAAATRHLPLLLLVRAVMGLGEGVAFPTMQAIIKGWVPLDKRSRSLSLMYSGHQIGSILSLLVSPYLLAHSVDALFWIFGLLGFVWLAFWHPLVSPQPSLHTQHHHDSDSSLAQADKGDKGGSGRGPSGPGGTPMPLRLRDLPWREFATSPPVWAIAMAHANFGISYNMFIAWMPTYYSENFALDVKQSSMMSVLPWAAMALGTNASGWTADYLINQKILGTTQTRKLLQLVGAAGPGLCLAYLALVPQTGFLFEAVVMLTLAMGLLGAQAGGFASNHQDIASRYAPILYGLTNAGASIAGSVGVYAVGAILDSTHSWALVLLMCAVCNFACATIYLAFATSEPLFD